MIRTLTSRPNHRRYFPDPASRAEQGGNTRPRYLRAVSRDPEQIRQRIYAGTYGHRFRRMAAGDLDGRDAEQVAYAYCREAGYYCGPDPNLIECVFLGTDLAQLCAGFWLAEGHHAHRGMERVILPALLKRGVFWADAGNPDRCTTPPTSGPVLKGSEGLHSAFGQTFDPSAFMKAVRLAATLGGPAGVETVSAHTRTVTSRMRFLLGTFHHLSGGRRGAPFSAGLVQVATFFKIDLSTASRLIHRLEAAGWIVRTSTGNTFTRKVSTFVWVGLPTPPAEVVERPEPQPHPEGERPVRLDEAVRYATAGQVPAGAERLGEDLAVLAGVAWHLGGCREGGEFHLGTVALAVCLNCSPATAGRRLHRLIDLGIVRRVRRGTPKSKKVSRYQWGRMPAASSV